MVPNRLCKRKAHWCKMPGGKFPVSLAEISACRRVFVYPDMKRGDNSGITGTPVCPVVLAGVGLGEGKRQGNLFHWFRVLRGFQELGLLSDTSLPDPRRAVSGVPSSIFVL